MAGKFISERNIKFMLYEVFDAESLTHYEAYAEHKDLAYMFQMMNEARIDVGMSAAAIASAAYYASLQYARERPQGRRLTSKDPTMRPVPIIEHADVKRMLLFQRAVVEGSFSLLMHCSLYADRAQVLPGEESGSSQ
jgi:butyryl-CoA dehydrogenase